MTTRPTERPSDDNRAPFAGSRKPLAPLPDMRSVASVVLPPTDEGHRQLAAARALLNKAS